MFPDFRKSWEPHLSQKDIRVSVVLVVTSMREWLCAGLNCLCVDAWTVMSVQGLRLWSLESGFEVWDCVELQQLEQSPEGELGKWSQKLPSKDSLRDRDRGWPWPQHVISRCILMLFLCASLLYIITKIILCLYKRVCSIKHRKQRWHSHTAHHSYYNTKLLSNCAPPHQYALQDTHGKLPWRCPIVVLASWWVF